MGVKSYMPFAMSCRGQKESESPGALDRTRKRL